MPAEHADPARPYRRWLHGCTLVFALEVALSAIHPRYPSDWLLENALAALLVALLLATARRFPF